MRVRTLRHFAVAVVLAFLVLPTACGGASPPDASGEVEIDGASPSSLPESESWRSDYNAEQLEAYESALLRWETFEELLEPIEAAGIATPEAKALFQEYFPSPQWMGRWEELEMYEEVEVRIPARPEVLWSRATAISDAVDSVMIEQCVDWRPSQAIQRGKPVPPVPEYQEPVLRVVSLFRHDQEWLVDTVVTTPGNGGKEVVPCDPLP